MSRRDATAAMLAVGLLALYVGLSDRILTFLRPQMRPYLVISGAVLAVVAVVVLLAEQRVASRAPATTRGTDADHGGDEHRGHDHDHDHDRGHRASRAGWMLLLPMFVAVVVAPGTLGAWAADRQRGVMFAGTYDFDVGPFLQAHAIAGTVPEMRLIDFSTAAADEADRAQLAAVSVQLTGFINRSDADAEVPDEVMLDRFIVGCCVADAALLEVRLSGEIPMELESEQWVVVTVRFDPEASPLATDVRRGESPVARVESVRPIDPPNEPYEYLYG